MKLNIITSIRSGNFWRGRGGYTLDTVVIHWWGDPDHFGDSYKDDDVFGVARYLSRLGGLSSATAVISGRRVCEIVSDNNGAWHSGDRVTNLRSIGLELDPDAQGLTRDAAVEYIYRKEKKYGLRFRIIEHRDVSATACPGVWSAADIRKRVDARHAEGAAPVSNPVLTKPAHIKVDGFWGRSTTKRLQKVLGTPQDGEVSSQSRTWRTRNPGLTTGWKWVSNPKGSRVVAALQRKLGVKPDGFIGPKTIKALQRRVGVTADGVISRRSRTVMALQKRLNEGRI
jgi:hypothetical protein